jgi:hypothetical protein
LTIPSALSGDFHAWLQRMFEIYPTYTDSD